ncbi:hypothetical protein RND71_008194 [Anisodus tanguticus]|uniref:RNase H type-1 domain-containing protein n=1 Tax=Anisodus tanguticus TaxID=243964 RepID=A0AAE1SMS5_9SOLA|nr:hypothetical protein RND71_008194 [Anisodus tanguticus]
MYKIVELRRSKAQNEEDGEETILMSAYGQALQNTTNNMAEAQAVDIGLRWCINNDIKKLEVKVDSKLLKDWIMNNIDTLWNLWDK